MGMSMENVIVQLHLILGIKISKETNARSYNWYRRDSKINNSKNRIFFKTWRQFYNSNRVNRQNSTWELQNIYTKSLQEIKLEYIRMNWKQSTGSFKINRIAQSCSFTKHFPENDCLFRRLYWICCNHLLNRRTLIEEWYITICLSPVMDEIRPNNQQLFIRSKISN